MKKTILNGIFLTLFSSSLVPIFYYSSIPSQSYFRPIHGATQSIPPRVFIALSSFLILVHTLYLATSDIRERPDDFLSNRQALKNKIAALLKNQKIAVVLGYGTSLKFMIPFCLQMARYSQKAHAQGTYYSFADYLIMALKIVLLTYIPIGGVVLSQYSSIKLLQWLKALTDRFRSSVQKPPYPARNRVTPNYSKTDRGNSVVPGS